MTTCASPSSRCAATGCASASTPPRSVAVHRAEILQQLEQSNQEAASPSDDAIRSLSEALRKRQTDAQGELATLTETLATRNKEAAAIDEQLASARQDLSTAQAKLAEIRQQLANPPAAAKASRAAREPLPGYDELTVPELTARLGELDDAGRERVREYEQTHRARKGVLSRL